MDLAILIALVHMTPSINIPLKNSYRAVRQPEHQKFSTEKSHEVYTPRLDLIVFSDRMKPNLTVFFERGAEVHDCYHRGLAFNNILC